MFSPAEKPSRERLPGLATVNSNLQYLSINETMAFFHGRSVKEHLGRSIVDTVQKSVQSVLLPAYRKVLTTGVAVENIVVEAPAGAQLKRCVVSYYPAEIDNNLLRGVHVVAVDITPTVFENSPDSLKCKLPPTQVTILKMIGECQSSKDIAHLLHVSLSTVCTHRKTILQKLDLHSTSELVRFAGQLSPVHPLSRG